MKWLELVKPVPLSFHPEHILATAIEELVNHKLPVAPVVDGGKLVGMLLLNEALFAARYNRDRNGLPVKEAMSA
ncbi:MAG: hypothetical protein K6T65_10700 [Peptococcaceae bacterium]|nr:hypothetical protein [Peptococcaceae bacterium]